MKEGGGNYCSKCLENGVCFGGYIPVYPKEHVIYLLIMTPPTPILFIIYLKVLERFEQQL